MVGLDPNQEIARKMNALLMPTVLILNKDRKVSWYHQGFIPGDEKEIEAQISTVLELDQEISGCNSWARTVPIMHFLSHPTSQDSTYSRFSQHQMLT